MIKCKFDIFQKIYKDQLSDPGEDIKGTIELSATWDKKETSIGLFISNKEDTDGCWVSLTEHDMKKLLSEIHELMDLIQEDKNDDE